MKLLFTLGALFVTVGASAMVLAPALRWFALRLEGGSRKGTFHVMAGEVMLRYIACTLGCLPIVTAPWALLSFVKWIHCQYEVASRLPSNVG